VALSRLYTVPEAAEALKVTEAAIRRWIWQRRLTVVKIGSTVRIEEAELARLIEAGPSAAMAVPSSTTSARKRRPVRLTQNRGPLCGPPPSRQEPACPELGIPRVEILTESTGRPQPPEVGTSRVQPTLCDRLPKSQCACPLTTYG
jgi:excisionase family DNA binding protein